MLKNVAFDSAATALAFRGYKKAVIWIQILTWVLCHITFTQSVWMQDLTYQHGFPIPRRAKQ